jgi:predicted RNA-binding protein YlxR (DUF448 family)
MKRDCKENLLRVVVEGNTLRLDEDGRMPGRGAYLHCRNRCIRDFVHKRTRELRSLKQKLSLDERRKLAKLIHARLDGIAAFE